MVIDSKTGVISWQPSNNQIGNHTIAVRVMDSLGAFSGQEFDLTVTGINTPPAIVSTPITNAGINQNYSYQVVANDIEGDTLSFSLNNAPAGMTIDQQTGLITWLPSTIGDYAVEVRVLDQQGATSTQTYNLQVGSEAINQNPVITSLPSFIADSNRSYTYQVVANDGDGDSAIDFVVFCVECDHLYLFFVECDCGSLNMFECDRS